jgi:hypothetical protein
MNGCPVVNNSYVDISGGKNENERGNMMIIYVWEFTTKLVERKSYSRMILNFLSRSREIFMWKSQG